MGVGVGVLVGVGEAVRVGVGVGVAVGVGIAVAVGSRQTITPTVKVPALTRAVPLVKVFPGATTCTATAYMQETT